MRLSRRATIPGTEPNPAPPAASSPTGPATIGMVPTNWYPTSVAKVRNTFKGSRIAEGLGTRHCFNGIADSAHALISLKPMDRVVAGPEGVHGDCRVGDELRPTWALISTRGASHAQPRFVTSISVAGTCATATHGRVSGMQTFNGGLGMEWSHPTAKSYRSRVTTTVASSSGRRPPGCPRGRDQGDVDMSRLIVSQEVYETCRCCSSTDQFENIMSAGYSVSLFTDWQKSGSPRCGSSGGSRRRPLIRPSPSLYGARLRVQESPPDHRALG